MIPFFRLFIPPRWWLNTATLGRIGYWGKMPGTNGSFIGLIWYTLFFHNLSPFAYFFCSLLSAWCACKICTQAELILNKKDPGCVILDEMIAIPFCFYGLQPSMQIYPVWWFMLLGFILFRIFDIFKPLGIKKLQTFPGGFGVVIDDIAAAFATCICLHLLILFFA